MFGTLSLEAKSLDGDAEKHVNPIALNEILFASMFTGDEIFRGAQSHLLHPESKVLL
jgi:hypothetical protein